MGNAPPSTTGSIGSHGAASGKPCSPRWPRPDGQATRPPSIAPMCGPTARPTAANGQAIGPSRGVQTTKIHALTDALGRPGVLLLTPGNASDVTTAPAVLAEAPGRIRHLAADKGYDADWLRADPRAQGITSVVPVGAVASAVSAKTSSAIVNAGTSRRPSTALKTSAGSPPDTTSSPATTPQPSPSPPLFGADRVQPLEAGRIAAEPVPSVVPSGVV